MFQNIFPLHQLLGFCKILNEWEKRVFGTSEDQVINKTWITHNFFQSLEKMKAVSWQQGDVWENGESKGAVGTH